MPTCLRHTDLPNTSKLFADFVYHFDRVAGYYEASPMNPDAYRDAAARIDYPESRRAAMAAVLREQNGESAALALFEKPGTVAVVTGQQVGLFSGPCYTIYKALTAAKLAARLNEQGIPAVTVFWLATEDHDFEEVRHAWSFGADQRPVSHEVRGPNGDPVPVGDVAPGDYPVAALRALLADLQFGEEVSTLVEESYAAGRTLGASFQRLLEKLLPKFGLLFLDPMRAGMRAIAAPLVADAVRASASLSARLKARNKELEAAGYHAQVHFEDKNSLFFLLEGGHRLTLRRDGETYLHATGKISSAELAARADHISPNALFRPVVQDYALPTVAQIGGPAEIAYLAQTQVLYQELGRRGPVVVPRAGFTLLDARGTKLMERYGLRIPHFYDGFEPLQQRIASALVPASLQGSIHAVRESATASLDKLRADLSGFDPTLATALDKSRAKMLYQLSKIEAKTARRALAQDQRAQTEAAYLYSLLYPNKHLQERVYTILPFLAKHGLDLIDRVHDELHLDCPDHLILSV